jgi:hypothetical protein
MIAVRAKAHPTVECRWCQKPIRVPKRVEDRLGLDTGEPQDLVSQTFTLRCRACERESVYSVGQISTLNSEIE